MQKITIEEYIAQRLDEQQHYYSGAARKAQKKYQTIKISETVLAATIPFLSALITPETTYIKVIVGLVGVAVTIAGGILLLYKHHENWINYRSTSEALKTQKFLFLAKAGPYKSRNRDSLLVENVEGLLGSEHQKWMQYSLQQNKNNEAEDEGLEEGNAESSTASDSESSTAEKV